jgi:hypothetical protein
MVGSLRVAPIITIIGGMVLAFGFHQANQILLVVGVAVMIGGVVHSMFRKSDTAAQG